MQSVLFPFAVRPSAAAHCICIHRNPPSPHRMGRRTKKVGVVGKYGTRYGASLRKQIKKIEITQHAKYTCGFCGQQHRQRQWQRGWVGRMDGGVLERQLRCACAVRSVCCSAHGLTGAVLPSSLLFVLPLAVRRPSATRAPFRSTAPAPAAALDALMLARSD